MNQGGHKTGAQLSAAMKSAPLYCTKNLRYRIPYNSSVGDKKKEKRKRNPTTCSRGYYLAALSDGGSFFRFLKSCAAFHNTDPKYQLIKILEKQPLQQITTPKSTVSYVLCNYCHENKNGKRKEKMMHNKKKSPSKQAHAYYNRSQHPHTAKHSDFWYY